MPLLTDQTDPLEHCVPNAAPEDEYEVLVRLAACACGTSMAAVFLGDTQKTSLHAAVGLSTHDSSRTQVFFTHTAIQNDLLIVTNTQADPRFADAPSVTGKPGVRFYAGLPLSEQGGQRVGFFCVMDTLPRTLTPEQAATLRLLAGETDRRLRATSLAAGQHLGSQRQTAERERLLLASVVETSEDAIYSKTLDGVVRTWNAAAERLYGYTAAEMIGQDVSLLVPEDRRAELADIMASLRRGERVALMGTVRRTKAGVRVDISLRVSPLVDASGRVIGASMIAHDISERKKASVLEAEQEFTHALLGSLQEGIVACDADGTLRLFNDTSREFHGLPEQPLPPEQWADHFDLYEKDGRTPMETCDIPLFRALQGEAVRDAEMVIAPKFGHARTLLANGQAIFGADGRKLGAVVAMHDITEKKQVEAALAASQARLTEAQHVANIGSWEYDIASGKITWSQEMFRLVGRDEALGEPAYGPNLAQYHPEDAAALADLVSRAIGHGEDYEIDLRLADAGEQTRWCHAVGKVVRDASGQVVRLVGTLSDITERKQAEERLREYAVILELQKDKLEKANAALEELATTDGLTSLSNHRSFQERLGEEASRAARYGTPLSLILLDVDEFKQYNDTFGHPAGDDVLKSVAQVLGQNARETDMVARYGGEEFALILPQTELAGALVIAQRLRAALEGQPWPKRAVTASFGVAMLRTSGESGADLIIHADQALYESKAAGRNRVTSAPAPATRFVSSPPRSNTPRSEAAYPGEYEKRR